MLAFVTTHFTSDQWGSFAYAQGRPSRGVVADGGGRAVELASPVVDEKRRVTFQVNAPEAKSISVTCDFHDEMKMAKGDDGKWSVTTDPIEPDIYYYNFVVDGCRTVVIQEFGGVKLCSTET